jgi:CheY-like chemotaxis protein
MGPGNTSSPKAFTPICAIPFANCRPLSQASGMTQPLALVLYEKLLPGSQLVNRLQDLNYRVQVVADASRLLECAEQAKPMLVLADLESTRDDVCSALARLRQNEATKHLPVIAFSGESAPELQASAGKAGATLIVSEAAILNHLPQMLEQALHIE